MTLLAATYPARVLSLVYLDAAVDYRRQSELAAEAGFGPPPDPVRAAILRGAAASHPAYANVRAPALNIVVVFDGSIQPHPNDAVTPRTCAS
jgi:pimeloyl-ACP methyl ester carboxylesterase